jgi:hypothetical protein
MEGVETTGEKGIRGGKERSERRQDIQFILK